MWNNYANNLLLTIHKNTSIIKYINIYLTTIIWTIIIIIIITIIQFIIYYKWINENVCYLQLNGTW